MPPILPDPTQRFSDRVEDYVRFRPGYPESILKILQMEADLSAESIIADVGSGTGISSELFLRGGCTVYGVEPNNAMRAAAEHRLGRNSRFHSVDGTAEATTLPPASMDFITAGQAFHWFDTEPAQREFARILRPTGYVALFWNTRDADSTPFLRAYEALLEAHGTDYRQSNHRNMSPERIEAFFPGTFRYYAFPNEQIFDYEGLKGRLLSSSYAPAPGHPQHEVMLQELGRIFEAYHAEGRIHFLYTTELYLGRFQ